MIESKADLKYYILQDRILNSKYNFTFLQKIKQLFVPDIILKYLYFLRKTEYFSNCRSHSLLRIFYKYRLRKLGIRLGFSIPINVFGPGLSIPHIGTIIVNNNARVGANCRLHACVNIGASGGNNKAPQIGDNVYIGPSVVMFGDISIADNVTIGANATVNKSFEDSNIVIAGCPARIVKENYPCWIEFNRIQFDTNRK